MPLNLPADLNTPVLNLFSLQGKVAIVTGGSRGIGLQVVTALAEAGADVAFIYLQHPDADDTAAKVAAQTGRRVQAFQCDVTNRQDISKTIHHITNTFGHGVLDIMVANAGVCQNVPSLQYTEQTWEYINKVNYDGAMWTAIPAGEIFKRQGYGSLIVTASVSATLINWPQTQAAYNASKAAVLQLARGLAVEWADFARVNCVSPGYVHTEMITKQPAELMSKWLAQIPGGRTCQPQELKGLYTFLASDASTYMTGSNVVIDGGLTLP